MAKRSLRRFQQIAGVARLAQRVRAHDADRSRRKRAHAFAEAAETVERPRRRLGGQAFTLVESGREPHELLPAIDEHELAAPHFGHDQVKAVGAQVGGGDHVRIRRREGERVLRVGHSGGKYDRSPCRWNFVPTR